jgi:uncharacterized Tic20 family protein
MSTTPTPESAPTPELTSTSEDRQMALLAHIGGALFSILVPLIIWLVKKDQSKFVDDQAKEALNFQITMLIGYFISGFSTLVLIGFVLLPGLIIANLVLGILAGVAANKGQVYRYPFALRLIK